MEEPFQFNFSYSSTFEKKDDLELNPIVQKAALFSRFTMAQLSESLDQEGAISEEERNILVKASFRPNTRGEFSLKDFNRNYIFRNLGPIKLQEIIKQVVIDKDDPVISMLVSYVNGDAPILEEQSFHQLVATRKVVCWLKGTGIDIPSEEEVFNRIREEEILRPFQVLINNFKGREKDLLELSDYVDWLPKSSMYKSTIEWLRNVINWHDKPPLMITGIGGVGKSTLVAKFILNHNNSIVGKKLPFIYFDFDKPGLSLSSPIDLAIDALSQLSVQFPKSNSILESIKKQLQSEFLERAAHNNFHFSTQSRGSDRGEIYSRFIKQFNKHLEKIDRPILVVFDSFEELQYRANPYELHALFRFVEEVSTYIPRLRPVFVGRSEISYNYMDFQHIRLEGFDQLSAISYLMAKGVNEEVLCKEIFKKIGGNPLTLILIAEIIKKENIHSLIQLESITMNMDKALMQELLVKRNLDHIHDPKTAKVAFPGILVRKITPEVIKEVLAIPCGLNDLTKEEANSIYKDLQNESFLVSGSGNEISFRQDLRIALYDIIMNNYKDQSEEIHERAIKFYSGKEDPKSKAEYLYHRLISGRFDHSLAQNYNEELRPYLENSLIELPDDAYVFLAGLMGIKASDEKISNATLQEWEEYQKSEIISLMKFGDEKSLKSKNHELSIRKERSRNSCLYYYEAKVAMKLGDFRTASKIIEKAILEGIENSIYQQLHIQLLKTDIYEYQMKFEDAFASISSIPILKIIQHSVENLDESQIPMLIETRLTWVRLAKRIGENKFNSVTGKIYGFITPFEEKIYNSLEKASKIDGLSSILPFPYKTFADRVYKQTHFENFGNLFAEMDNTFNDMKEFNKSYKQLSDNVRNSKDLENFLVTKYGLNLKDICEPGVFKINLVDVVKFSEMVDYNRKLFEFTV